MPHDSEKPTLLYPFQAEALAILRAPKIHLALTSPTGSGKGVILEELARNPGERILLLTPLIALGRQQLERFAAKEVPAESGFKGRTPERVWISCPEAAIIPKNSRRIREWRPTLVVIDEAHCLQEWGENFRPSYKKIPELVASLGATRTLWMSATFPKSTVNELKGLISGPWEVRGRFAMPEKLKITERQISYSARIEAVRASILPKTTPGILFAGTRKNVENYTSLLTREGIRALPYHAGLSDEERRGVEKKIQLDTDLESGSHSVVATNAFGMGMDYSHLKWVTLAQAPFSLLSLMQSLGRVARGSREGFAEVYWAEEDFRIAGFLARDKAFDSKESKDLELLRRYLMAKSEEKFSLLGEVFL